MADSWEDDDFEPVVNVVAAPAPVASVAADDESDGGNWDDDDFEAPAFNQTLPKNNDEEEEEDLAFEKPEIKTSSGAPTKAQEALLRKQAAEEAAILNQVKSGGLKGETAEQKRIRERKQQEEADLAQAIDAFGGFTVKTEKTEKATKEVFAQLTKGIGSVVLKTKQDHTNFGFNTHLKLLGSKPEHLVAFYKGLSVVLAQNTFTLAILAPIIADFTAIHQAVEKREREKGITVAPRADTATKAAKSAVVDDCGDDDWLGGDDGDFGDMVVPSKAKDSNQSEDSILEQQHEDYGTALSLKLARSTPQNITAFYKSLDELLTKVEWTSRETKDMYNIMMDLQLAREAIESKMPKVKTAKETKMEKLNKEKRAEAIFGKSKYVDDYEHFSAIEDDYLY